MKFADAKIEEYVAPTVDQVNWLEIHNTKIVVFKCTPPINQATGLPLWKEEPFARLALIPTQGAIQYGNQHIAYDSEVRYETPLIFNSRLILPSKRYQSLYAFKQKTDYQFHGESFGELLKNIESILPKTEEITF
jgi:hypothetical protein